MYLINVISFGMTCVAIILFDVSPYVAMKML